MYKKIKIINYFYVLIFLLNICFVNAVMCGDKIDNKGVIKTAYDYCSINSGTPYQLLVIPECSGKIIAKIRTKIPAENYYMNDFIKQDNKLWTSTCRNKMPIVLMTTNKTENEFDIVLEYYEKPLQNTGNKENDELYNNNFKKTLTYSNIRANYKVGEPNINIFNLDDMGNSLYFIFGFVLIIIMILILIGRYVWKNILNDEKNEITNEKKKTNTLDEELNNILKDIEK